MDARVRVEAETSPSEDLEKVSKAIENVTGLKPEVSGGKVVLESDSKALLVLYRKIRDRNVVSSVRRLLLEHKTGGSTWLYLNRQAAYVGKLVVCEGPEESPLGPIKLVIESDSIDEVIDWLAPESSL